MLASVLTLSAIAGLAVISSVSSPSPSMMSAVCLLQSTLAVWVKWPQHHSAPLLNGSLRQHGAVCHQDPR